MTTTLQSPDERQRDGHIVWQTYPSWAQFSWLYLLSAVTALRGAMFVHFGVDGWKPWMMGAIVLLLCAVVIRRWAHYELTRERIIVRNGYTGREISSVHVADVRAVTVHQGIVAGFFGIGTLAISSLTTDRLLSLRGIRDPEEVKIRIQASAWRKGQQAADPRPE